MRLIRTKGDAELKEVWLASVFDSFPASPNIGVMRFILAFLVSVASVGLPDVMRSAEPVFFHDKLISAKLLQAGEELIGEGGHVSAEKLRGQLERRNCELALPKPSAKSLTSVGLVQARRPGTLIVSSIYKCDKCTKWHAGNASGVALTRSGIFATCYHAIAATNSHAFVVGTVDGRTAPVVEVLAADKKSDVAICRAEGIRFDPTPLAAANPVEGSPVSVISHPKGRFYTLTTGQVSRYFFKPISKSRSVPFMAITAEFAKGSSGGPVLDANGNLVGLAASTYSIYYNVENGRQENMQMTLRHCVPVEAIHGLIRQGRKTD